MDLACPRYRQVANLVMLRTKQTLCTDGNWEMQLKALENAKNCYLSDYFSQARMNFNISKEPFWNLSPIAELMISFDGKKNRRKQPFVYFILSFGYRIPALGPFSVS